MRCIEMEQPLCTSVSDRGLKDYDGEDLGDDEF